MPLPDEDGLPDFKYINRIPIVKLARELGMDFGDNGKILCWHPDKHKDGKPAFLRVLTKLNRVRCDACGSPSMSVIDMLMDIGNFDSPLTAVQCFARELSSFSVPNIPKGSHLNNPDALNVPPALKEPLALLVRSGVWSTLPVPVQRLIPVFLELTEWGDGVLEGTLYISNRAMMRYSGIGSFTSISQALTKLESMGWATRLEATLRGDSPIEATKLYRVTPLSETVRQLAISTSPTFGDTIKADKAIRKRQREERSRVLQSQRQNRFG
jgi:hypothetical protein